MNPEALPHCKGVINLAMRASEDICMQRCCKGSSKETHTQQTLISGIWDMRGLLCLSLAVLQLADLLFLLVFKFSYLEPSVEITFCVFPGHGKPLSLSLCNPQQLPTAAALCSPTGLPKFYKILCYASACLLSGMHLHFLHVTHSRYTSW